MGWWRDARDRHDEPKSVWAFIVVMVSVNLLRHAFDLTFWPTLLLLLGLLAATNYWTPITNRVKSRRLLRRNADILAAGGRKCEPIGSASLVARMSARSMATAVQVLVEFVTGGLSVNSESVEMPRRRFFGMVFWRWPQAARFAESARRAEAWSFLGGGWFRLGAGHLVARNGWVSPPVQVGAQRSLGPLVVTGVSIDGECITLVHRRSTQVKATTGSVS
jgi:hypothetical protein